MMPGLEPSTSVFRNRHSNDMTNMLIVMQSNLLVFVHPIDLLLYRDRQQKKGDKSQVA